MILGLAHRTLESVCNMMRFAVVLSRLWSWVLQTLENLFLFVLNPMR